MIFGQFLLFFILVYDVVHGIAKVITNKKLILLHKTVWIAIMMMLPILGTSAYLRTTFAPRE